MVNSLTIAAGGKRTLAEQAYLQIRDAIIDINLEPGRMVYESELAQSMGMSRTPVREALRTLQGDDLIEVLPQKGVRIAYISERKVEESRFVRESLEMSAFRLLCRHWDRENPKLKSLSHQLESLIEDQKKAAAAGDAKRFLSLDESFHNHFLQQTENQTLLTIVLHTRAHLNRLRYLMLKELYQMEELIVEHELLYRAVISNNESLVTSILEKHLRKLNDEFPNIRVKFPHYFSK